MTEHQRAIARGVELGEMESAAVAAGFNPSKNEYVMGFEEVKKVLLTLDAKKAPSFYLKAYVDGNRICFSQRYEDPNKKEIFVNPQTRGTIGPRLRTSITASTCSDFVRDLESWLITLGEETGFARTYLDGVRKELKNKVMYNGFPNQTIGRFLKYYPKKGDRPISFQLREKLRDVNFMRATMNSCGFLIESEYVAPKRIPYVPIPQEESIVFAQQSSLGLPTLEKPSGARGAEAMKITMGLCKKIMDTCNEQFHVSTGFYPNQFANEFRQGKDDEMEGQVLRHLLKVYEDWLTIYYHNLMTDYPELTAAIGKFKSDMYDAKKIVANEGRFYTVFPGHLQNIMRTVMQPFRDAKISMKTDPYKHSMLGFNLQDGGGKDYLAKMLKQLRRDNEAYAHYGDDSHVIYVATTPRGRFYSQFDLDCSSFDMTQRREFRQVAIRYISEQLCGIDPVAGLWWKTVNNTRLVNIAEAFMMKMEHGGPSGIDGITEVNDLLMDIAIQLCLSELPREYFSDGDDIHADISRALHATAGHTRFTIKLGQLSTVFMSHELVTLYNELPSRLSYFDQSGCIYEEVVEYEMAKFEEVPIYTRYVDGKMAETFFVDVKDIGLTNLIDQLPGNFSALGPNCLPGEGFADMVQFASLFIRPFIFLGYEFGKPRIEHFPVTRKSQEEVQDAQRNETFVEIERYELGLNINLMGALDRVVPALSFPCPQWIKGTKEELEGNLLLRLAGQCMSMGEPLYEWQMSPFQELVASTWKRMRIYSKSLLTLDLPQVESEVPLPTTWDGLLKVLKRCYENCSGNFQDIVDTRCRTQGSGYMPWVPHPEHPEVSPPVESTPQNGMMYIPSCTTMDRARLRAFIYEDDPALEEGAPGEEYPTFPLEPFDWHNEDDEMYIRPAKIKLDPIPRPHGSVSDDNFGKVPPTAVWGPDKPKRIKLEVDQEDHGKMSKSQKRRKQRVRAREKKFAVNDSMGFHETGD